MNNEATVTIDGQKYRVSDIKAAVRPVPKPELTIGNVVKIKGSTEPYLVCRTPNDYTKAILIGLDSAWVWSTRTSEASSAGTVLGNELFGNCGSAEFVVKSAADYYSNLARASRGL